MVFRSLNDGGGKCFLGIEQVISV